MTVYTHIQLRVHLLTHRSRIRAYISHACHPALCSRLSTLPLSAWTLRLRAAYNLLVPSSRQIAHTDTDLPALDFPIATSHSCSNGWRSYRSRNEQHLQTIHVVFFTKKMSEKVIDISVLSPYYRGSSWAKKLYRDQKQKIRKNSTFKTSTTRRCLFFFLR